MYPETPFLGRYTHPEGGGGHNSHNITPMPPTSLPSASVHTTHSSQNVPLLVPTLFFFFLYLFILAVPGLNCSMWDLHCSVHYLLVAACGLLSCGIRDLVPRPGMEPGPLVLGAWSLTHWTTREILGCLFLNTLVSWFPRYQCHQPHM